jgi:glucose-1-phosphate cytidylyltransferase
MEKLAERDDLSAYVHCGFWHTIDTLRDRMCLEQEWSSRKPLGRVW